jgi:hypothetical protein
MITVKDIFVLRTPTPNGSLRATSQVLSEQISKGSLSIEPYVTTLRKETKPVSETLVDLYCLTCLSGRKDYIEFYQTYNISATFHGSERDINCTYSEVDNKSEHRVMRELVIDTEKLVLLTNAMAHRHF